jgi:hypothetical protein
MSQSTNAARSNKPILSSPIVTTNKSYPLSSSTVVSVMKLKHPNHRLNASLSETKSDSLQLRLNPSKYVAEQRAKARDIVSGLQRKSIKLVAIDFDNTFLSIHTGGYYQGPVENLLEYIRPTFFYLMQEILDSPAFHQTLHVCIVSFSSQDQLIRKLLQLAFKTS